MACKIIPGPTLSPTFRLPTNLTTRLFLAFSVVGLAVFIFTTTAQAQLTLGAVSDPVPLSSCPGSGWFDPGGTTHMSCVAAVLIACPNAQNLGFTFGYVYPTVAYKGTIVFLTGGDGTTPATAELGELDYARAYYDAGYEIVQIKWDSAWEQTDVPSQSNTPYPPNIQYAACRPATFLKFVNDNYFTRGTTIKNAICAQGGSAGSAQVAYSLAFYGAGGYLDNVELLSGPPLSDIEQGCQHPDANLITVCGQNDDGGGHQNGCKLGTGGSTWQLSPKYVQPALNGVRSWTNDSTTMHCGGASDTTQWNSFWYQMSIVETAVNNPTFSYPNTAMAAWLCRSLQNPGTAAYCAAHSGDAVHCLNNTPSQGQIFYGKITFGNIVPPKPYAVYAVDGCDKAEGVTNSRNVPGFTPNTLDGFDAISTDMKAKCVNNH